MRASIGHIRAGRVAAACGHHGTRSPALPDIPTMGEFVPGLRRVSVGVRAPNDTPATSSIASTRDQRRPRRPKDQSATRRAGLHGARGSPADFGKFLAEETEKWAKVIRAANIKAE